MEGMEWGAAAMQRGRIERQSRSGRLQWAASVSARGNINRCAMAVRASPPRLQSTLFARCISMSLFGLRARHGSAESRYLLSCIIALNRLGLLGREAAEATPRARDHLSMGRRAWCAGHR
jgi:hypothetical protein